MKFVRFVFPFLFVRNWHSGSWEVSIARLVMFGGFLLLWLLGFFIAYMLQAPVVYKAVL
jgi:hypothetical protein